jgi:hypothetical protein
MDPNQSRTMIWVMAFLDYYSEELIRTFFVESCGIKKRLVQREMHCTIYHARRRLAGLSDIEEPISILVPGSELRMMVMAPGGENPRPDIDPSNRSVGIRIRRADGAAKPFEAIRERFLSLETPTILGSRPPSTRLRA